uniref:Putative secreted peptide n=1 Tax=Anopheles braziliensis TaxID=58242 RepID=A0A2M3ZPI0_9DIPT
MLCSSTATAITACLLLLLLIGFVDIFLYRLRHTAAADGNTTECDSRGRRGHSSRRMARFDTSCSRTAHRGVVVHTTSQCLPLRVLALVCRRWCASRVAVRYVTVGTITG